jgi:hypothetical protein
MTGIFISLSFLVLIAPLHQSSAQIRSVDWENFTYPWYPSDTHPPYKVRKLTLVNGEFIVYQNRKRRIENLSVQFANASYADLTGDGREEAIVTISGTETFNSFTGCIFVYTIRAGKLALLWRHEIGDRAAGGLRRIKAGDRMLTVEQYDNEASAMCCPKKYVRSVYAWNGRRFLRTKSETLENAHGNAAFLGYADNSQ